MAKICWQYSVFRRTANAWPVRSSGIVSRVRDPCRSSGPARWAAAAEAAAAAGRRRRGCWTIGRLANLPGWRDRLGVCKDIQKNSPVTKFLSINPNVPFASRESSSYNYIYLMKLIGYK